jgi:hypothetical protein
MTEYGSDPNLDHDIVKHADAVEKVVKLQHESIELQSRVSVTPTQYLGRYTDSLKMAMAQRDQLVKYIDSLAAKELMCKKAFDSARGTPNQTQDNISRLSIELDCASTALSLAKQDERNIYATLEAELPELRSMEREEVESHACEFVEARIAACRQNIELWESLQTSLLDIKVIIAVDSCTLIRPCVASPQP